MLGTSGLVFACPMIMYSTKIHTRKLRNSNNGDLLANLIMLWAISYFAAAAVIFQSTLYGYIVFSLVFTLLGFRMFFFGLGVTIGWDNCDALSKSMRSSFLILLIYTIIRWCGVRTLYLAPFSSAICVLGANCLFLAKLIKSSTHY